MQARIAEVLRVALPLMVSTGCLTLTLFTDRTLLLWVGEEQMGASMAGGNLFWSLVCFPVGITSMTSAIVAQFIGAKQPEKVGRFMWQAVWVSLICGPLYLLLIPRADLMFTLTGQADSLIEYETTYMRWLLVGASGAVLESALAGFFSGIRRTSIVMLVNIVATVINIVLDVVLIFGVLGFPELGIAGAGIASAVSLWFKGLTYLLLMVKGRTEEGVSFDAIYVIRKGIGIDLALAGKLLFFGVPAGMQYFAESGGFSIIVLQIGQLGSDALAATAMAINFNMAAFVPLLGVATAASVLVGQHLVESGYEKAKQAGIAAMLVGMGYATVWALIYLTIPKLLLSFYSLGDSSLNSAASLDLAVTLMQFVAVYCLLDAVQLVLGGALRGAGDTWFVLVVSLSAITVWIAIGILGEGYVMPRDDLTSADASRNGLYWWWVVMSGWIATLTVLMSLRFWRGRWRDKQMVEN